MQRLFYSLIVLWFIFIPFSFAHVQKHPVSFIDKSQHKVKEFQGKVEDILRSITPDKQSALEKSWQEQYRMANNPYGIAFYKPTYFIPFYYTDKPYDAIYANSTPDNQSLNRLEMKVQISLQLPILTDEILPKDSSLNIGFTQTFYWQFYANSQYFRETNYEPELFFSKKLLPNWLFTVGVSHQSNGRGGALERSWNRLYGDLRFSGSHWLVSIKPWMLIFKSKSSNLHNYNISRYLGHGELLLAYTYKNNTFSLLSRNNLETGFKRGTTELDWSFPIYGHVKGYLQVFSGYGQSLIEYDHYTSSVGLGLALSDAI